MVWETKILLARPLRYRSAASRGRPWKFPPSTTMASARVTESEMIHREATPRSRGLRPSQTAMATLASMAMIAGGRHRGRCRRSTLLRLDAGGSWVMSCNDLTGAQLEARIDNRESRCSGAVSSRDDCVSHDQQVHLCPQEAIQCFLRATDHGFVFI